MIKAEVVIVGYGPAAMTTAAVLGKQGISTVIVNPFSDYQKPLGAARLLALSLSSIELFKEHGLVGNMQSIGQQINKIKIAQYKKDGTLDFEPQSIGHQDFGYMVNEDDIWQSLYQDVKANSNVTIINGQVFDVEHQKNNVLLKLVDGRTVLSTLLIAADSKNSVIRKKLHFELEKRSYGQVALVCDISHTKNHQGIARELFMKNGPFATLPKIGGFSSSIVWTESKDSEAFLRSLDDQLLEEIIANRCSEDLGTIKLASKPSLFPLTLTVAKEAIAERVALVGDAWHAIHPLAGQGLNLGLRDIKVLTDLVIQEKRLGLDIGNIQMLKKYQSRRKDDVSILIASMDIINNIYKSKLPLVPELGQAMLRTINNFSFLKNLFMSYAAGHNV